MSVNRLIGHICMSLLILGSIAMLVCGSLILTGELKLPPETKTIEMIKETITAPEGFITKPSHSLETITQTITIPFTKDDLNFIGGVMIGAAIVILGLSSWGFYAIGSMGDVLNFNLFGVDLY